MDVYRCLAERRTSQWVAICVDLNITVQGRSYREARTSLERAVAHYLERAAKLPEGEPRRQAPWTLRAKYGLRTLATRFRRASGPRESSWTHQAVA